jgi:hypothetical protein
LADRVSTSIGALGTHFVLHGRGGTGEMGSDALLGGTSTAGAGILFVDL